MCNRLQKKIQTHVRIHAYTAVHGLLLCIRQVCHDKRMWHSTLEVNRNKPANCLQVKLEHFLRYHGRESQKLEIYIYWKNLHKQLSICFISLLLIYFFRTVSQIASTGPQLFCTVYTSINSLLSWVQSLSTVNTGSGHFPQITKQKCLLFSKKIQKLHTVMKPK